MFRLRKGKKQMVLWETKKGNSEPFVRGPTYLTHPTLFFDKTVMDSGHFILKRSFVFAHFFCLSIYHW